MTKDEKLQVKALKKGKGLWQEFKKFITRGNILDMSVGVIMGGAFNAIVTAFTNILLSIATWAVPGGLKGLVTVLPAINSAQAGMNTSIGLNQYFNSSELHALAEKLALANYDAATVAANPNLIESSKATILSKYTLHGTVYTYNMSAIIDWGTFINAIISFLIIAATLFIIVKVFTTLKAKRELFEKNLKATLVKEEPTEVQEPKAE